MTVELCDLMPNGRWRATVFRLVEGDWVTIERFGRTREQALEEARRA